MCAYLDALKTIRGSSEEIKPVSSSKNQLKVQSGNTYFLGLVSPTPEMQETIFKLIL